MSLVTYGLAAAGAATLAAAYIYREKLGLGGGRKKTVMLLRPNDRHFTDVKVTETDLSLDSPKIKGITRHFTKKHLGWTEDKTGNSRYFGREGVDYTLTIKGQETHVINLLDALKIALTDVDLGKFTPDALQTLGAAKFGITTEATTDEAAPGAKGGAGNESRHTESDHAMIDYYADKVHKAMKTKFEWMPILLGFSLGAFLVYLAANAHWIKVA